MSNCFSQETIDSLYLGQSSPGNTPEIFPFSVSAGCFDAERIAISPDGKEIYYSELNGYPGTVSRIKYYKYSDSLWNGPFILFNDNIAPGLSVDGKALYLQNLYSVKNDTGWSTPAKFWNLPNSIHYLHNTNSGNYYLSTSNVTGGIGGTDWSKLVIGSSDTTILSLGLPINTSGDDVDFSIAMDESFIIIVNNIGLCISYHKQDGGWTNPKTLGSTINAFAAHWGPYVTSDNKYLFYTAALVYGDYSSVHIFWARVDHLIDSLKHTNFVPYVKKNISSQSDMVGQLFTFTMPDSTFIDDDGNNTLTYSATLSNGTPLPSWLSFDSIALSFSGTPIEVSAIRVKVKATDTAHASVSCTFQINVLSNTAVNQIEEQKIHLFPNPTRGELNITLGNIQCKEVRIELFDLSGKLVLTKDIQNTVQETINISGFSNGLYLVNIVVDGRVAYNERICLE